MQKVTVQEAIFQPSDALSAFLQQTKTSGAVCHFLGLVRDYRDDAAGQVSLSAMRLEHYPEMTEQVLNSLVTEAEQRFRLEQVRLIHRFGMMQPHECIVMVIAASPHRADAFAACEFLMDRLKTEAPFWKCEYTTDGQTHWVDAQKTDDNRAARWKATT